MSKTLIPSLFLVVALGSSSLAQEDVPSLQLEPGESAPTAEQGEEADVTTFAINCYTDKIDCYGRANFVNNDSSRYASYAVFFNNGANGRSNFVLEPGGGDHSLSGIRYNDTYAAVFGQNGVPDGTQRKFIFVCCN